MVSKAMLVLFVVVSLYGADFVGSTDSVTEGTELVFAFMVHRHGDRTPVESTLSFVGDSVDLTQVQDLIEPYGYGQVTDVGLRSGYKCGEFIRRRYDELLSDKFNKSELYLRTTDSTRVKMTSLSAMSAVFPAGFDNWSRDVNWTPVPYTTVPAKYDYNLAYANCPIFTAAYYSSFTQTERMKPYADTIEKVSSLIGINITSTPVLVFVVYDVFVSLKSLGYDLSEEIKELMDDMSKANNEAWDITTGNDNYIQYQAGPLLNEFFKYANETIAGSDTPRVRIYPAHDYNVYSLEAITRINRQGAPKYASLYSLELRKVTATGQYVVLPVYLDDPNVGEEKYLQIEGCSGEFLCDFYEFLNITSQYLLDEDTWRTECGFDTSLVVDTSSID